MTAQEYKAYFKSGITYNEYLQRFSAEIASGEESKYAQYLPQNWQRQARLDRKLKLRDNVLEAIVRITSPINWLLITEHWCGDASQINPVINKIAEASMGMITLRIVYRDENEALIDAHLTDGRSRSIPILIQMDEGYNVVATYGPRPAEAQRLVKELLATGEPYNIPLHTWYAKNKQQSIQDDIAQLITA